MSKFSGLEIGQGSFVPGHSDHLLYPKATCQIKFLELLSSSSDSMLCIEDSVLNSTDWQMLSE